MKLLFLCRHNVFRSRVAEAVFRKYNRNSKIKVISRGLVPAKAVFPNTIKSVNEIGYNISGKPKGLKFEEMMEQDIIVIVSDDIPRDFFVRYPELKAKIVYWKIPDTSQDKTNEIQRISKEIEMKVKNLVEELK